MAKYVPLKTWYDEIEQTAAGDLLNDTIANMPHQQLADCIAFLAAKVDLLEGKAPPVVVVPPPVDIPVVPPVKPPVKPTPPPYVPPPYVPPSIDLFEMSLGSTQSFKTGASPTISARNPDFTNKSVNWGCHVSGFDSSGSAIYLGTYMRGTGTTDSAGRVSFTVPNLPSPASLSAKVTELRYGFTIGGASYDNNFNGAQLIINNGLTVSAGVKVTRGRLTSLKDIHITS